VTPITLALRLHHLTSVQPPRKVRTSLIASAILAVAALLLLGAVVLRHHRKPSATNTSRIGLNVEREGQVLLVAWDRSSRPVHNASHAILTIKDGPQQSQTDLNRQQLRAANVKYWPETRKVTFKLEVYHGDRSSRPVHNASHAILTIKDGPQQSQTDLNRQQLRAANVKYWPETRRVTFKLEVYHGDGSTSESVQVSGEPASAPAAPAKLPMTANASLEPDRPSPFAVRTRREIRLAMPNPQPRLLITAAVTPPPPVAEIPDQESRLGRMMSKIPLLRRLKKHPQHSENEYPLR